MIEHGVGGAKTKTGLYFERATDLKTLFQSLNNYNVDNDNQLFYKNKLIGLICKQHSFYKFLESRNINWKNHISKKILPDDSIYVILNNTFYVLECKYQQVKGSVDEKLQTCHFKKQQYKKLLYQLNMGVEYIYILNDWFKDPCYKDVLDYIISVDCQYYFNYIPLQKIGLPIN